MLIEKIISFISSSKMHQINKIIGIILPSALISSTLSQASTSSSLASSITKSILSNLSCYVCSTIDDINCKNLNETIQWLNRNAHPKNDHDDEDDGEDDVNSSNTDYNDHHPHQSNPHHNEQSFFDRNGQHSSLSIPIGLEDDDGEDDDRIYADHRHHHHHHQQQQHHLLHHHNHHYQDHDEEHRQQQKYTIDGVEDIYGNNNNNNDDDDSRIQTPMIFDHTQTPPHRSSSSSSTSLSSSVSEIENRADSIDKFRAQCMPNERFCSVIRLGVSAPDNVQEFNFFALKRSCSEQCTDGCFIIGNGEKTKLSICSSCCTSNNCNIGNFGESNLRRKIYLDLIVLLATIRMIM
ncbi:hypothetical protein SSS_03044 [Sarcoptes scabiei]|uniref:Uncharacterized protein n=1 Tax=Sarcoptes scabiei TaxID=52283 RepID=A0A834VEA1_SARSC|nr:hypothetical protein SSS_03044 [Sarcoptes scabiei]